MLMRIEAMVTLFLPCSNCENNKLLLLWLRRRIPMMYLNSALPEVTFCIALIPVSPPKVDENESKLLRWKAQDLVIWIESMFSRKWDTFTNFENLQIRDICKLRMWSALQYYDNDICVRKMFSRKWDIFANLEIFAN